MTMMSSTFPRVMLIVLLVSVAAPVGIGMWEHYATAPWTRDGRVRADIIAVAPDVSGLVDEVLIKDNQLVRKGDVMLRLDAEPFRLAVSQAEAALANREAAAEKAAGDRARYEKLSEGVVSQQQRETIRAADLQAKALYDQATADLAIARLNLDRSEIRAPANGRVTQLDLRPGTYVTAGRGILALMDTDTVRVEGYFEETTLPQIHVGDVAAARLMGGAKLRGRIESIARSIDDRDKPLGTSLLASVNPFFSWDRLTQRITVRIHIESKDIDRLIVGATAMVEVVGKAQSGRLKPRPSGRAGP
ncbi:efflux transporter periplasmic adaptor subunit [Rhodopseudomonas palustris]|uniref:Efflux transporter periplasmic adaptor subunit n=1 Tax=Rhodopseudomonas palustris TaxID=1076 RepID=A0A323UCK6_RHOPL|nr:HlyD family secretion protein [Rhodopseudomonas palustris]PZA10464.1 efflux transporter periplasmic adaptor subunit [Rhodopseudomonas palustris]